MNRVAFAYAATVTGGAVVWSHYSDVDDDDLYPWMQRVRAVVRPHKRWLMPLLTMLAFWLVYAYTDRVILPMLPGHPVADLLVLLIGTGLGLSIGRHLTHRDYSAIGGLGR
jgi:antibiotic biosynthesis monooxygenase (ABM) superfamily enzyme